MKTSRSNMLKVATDVGLSVSSGGLIESWHVDTRSCNWEPDYLISDRESYSLDFCALKLNSVEAFIVVCAAATIDPIESFDDKAVRQFIRQLNLDWEFVT